jgi:carboxypeptidase PM20D1
MRRLLLGLAAVLLILVIIVGVRTATVKSRQLPARTVAAIAVDSAAIAQHLAEAVRIRTVSENGQRGPAAPELEALHRWMQRSYPKVHATLAREVIDGASLLYTWKGSDPTLKPLLLMAHQDVVPVDRGTDSAWTHPPFDGVIDRGTVWGRGSFDNKSALVGILEAMERLVASGATPKRTVMLAFGHNEEVFGSGAGAIADTLEKRGQLPSLVLDEGAVVTQKVFPGIEAPIALIGVAEKGYQTFELSAVSGGGHSSMPPRHSSVGRISRAIVALEDHPMPAHLDGASRELLEYLAPAMPVPLRAVFSNLWLFGPVVERILAQKNTTDALQRTTTAPTMLQGSAKDNVLAARATATVNFRIAPGETADDVERHIKAVIADDSVTITRIGHGNSPSAVSSTATPEFRVMQEAVAGAYPEALVAPFMVMAGTDSRHFSGRVGAVFRFGPVSLTSAEIAGAHGTDERMTIANMAHAVVFYETLVRRYAIDLR